ncbi:zinc-finger domain-containing protein [Bacillus manliponensis]|nr:zinc-finger domain-containing protein [Bacillus manliponensis]
MGKEEKRKIRLQISKVLDENCKGCEVLPKGLHWRKKIDWCYENCPIGKSLRELGKALDSEGRTDQMAEERNWNQLCEKAEKLREQNLSWAKIADHLGIGESTLYYHISKRREPSEKRVGVAKENTSIKPSIRQKKAEKTLRGHSEITSEVTTLSSETMMELKKLKEQVKFTVEENNLLKQEKEQLQKELLAETKMRLQAGEYTEFYQNQYHQLEEDYETLKNEFNLLNEKKWELENQLRKAHENLRLSEEIVSQEREHRLELQGRSQALGMALKAVL